MLTTSKETRFGYLRRLMVLPLLIFTVLLFAFRLQKQDANSTVAFHTNAKFKLVVDAGHGGKDNGAIGVNGIAEKNVNLAVSKKIKELSGEYGIEVVLTRENDVFMSPPEKVEFANKQNADAFISVHAAIAEDTKKKGEMSGVEVFVSSGNKHFDESKILGSAVLQSLGNDFKVNTPLMQRQVGIWVLKANVLPAILIECGYLDNKNDANYLADDTKIQMIARKILEAVVAYENNNIKTPYDVKKLSS